MTTIKRDPRGVYSQCLMDGAYPVVTSTGSNPGNTLLFGAGARFISMPGLPKFVNGVVQLDSLGWINMGLNHYRLRKPVVIGYIVGGIQSTLPNTNTSSDTAASPYVFSVTLIPDNR